MRGLKGLKDCVERSILVFYFVFLFAILWQFIIAKNYVFIFYVICADF